MTIGVLCFAITIDVISPRSNRILSMKYQLTFIVELIINFIVLYFDLVDLKLCGKRCHNMQG